MDRSNQKRMIQAIRNEMGLSVFDAKRAVQIGSERFSGNPILGALWVHANSLAVNIRGDRAAWNDTIAYTSYEKLKHGP